MLDRETLSEDVEALVRRAAEAAWEETSTLRMAAIRKVFEDCGTAARLYADPGTVAKLFVKAATKEFLRQRQATEYKQPA